ncbi:MAG: hypothetical protein WEF53_09090 [Bacteroidota bacterium]
MPVENWGDYQYLEVEVVGGWPACPFGSSAGKQNGAASADPKGSFGKAFLRDKRRD